MEIKYCSNPDRSFNFAMLKMLQVKMIFSTFGQNCALKVALVI